MARMVKPYVSVITIFLNEERFIDEAVASVMGQSFRDWELLLIDDGSTDRSSAIAQHYAQIDRDRIRYLCHPGLANRGMSASRNLGLSRAVGEVIAFLDADDVWLPNKLAEQISALNRHPEAGLLYGRTLIWHSWITEITTSDFLYELGVLPDRLYQPPELLEILLENKAQTPTSCNAIMRRALFDRIGGFDESFRGMFEDQVFFAKALLCAPTYVDSRVWALYRQHDRSSVALSDARGDTERARLRFLQWLKQYLRENDNVDKRLHDVLHSELSRCRLAIAKNIFDRWKSNLRRLMHQASPA